MHTRAAFLETLKLREFWISTGRLPVTYARRAGRVSWERRRHVFYAGALLPAGLVYDENTISVSPLPPVVAGMFLSEALPDHPLIRRGLELVEFEEQLTSIFPHRETYVDFEKSFIGLAVQPVQDEFWETVKTTFPAWTRKKLFHREQGGRVLRETSIAPHAFGAFLWRRHEDN
jgi:hypothetical protein